MPTPTGSPPADHLTHRTQRPRTASRPPLRRHRDAVLARAALALLAGLLGLLSLLSLLSPIAAQSATTLVSNAGQESDTRNSHDRERSQAFTTGDSGATLSRVEIISEDTHFDDAAVSLCTVDGSNHPTSSCTPLTAPSRFLPGTLVFTAPADTTLEANTTYSVLIESPGNENLLLAATYSDDEDDGRARNWTIDNTFYQKNLSDEWVAYPGPGFARSLRITIKGALTNNAPTVATAIPDQTATTGAAFSYAFPAATFTDADSDTLTYTATLADDTALPTWLTFSAATRAFSGTPQTADAGTVSVKVTASDGSDSVSDTFDIVVSVPPDTTAPRVASIVRRIPTSSPTNADSLTWRVTFSEAVSNVDAADFAVRGATATMTAVATVSGVTGAYDVTTSGGNLAGVSATVTLAIASSHNIQDAASNALSNTAPTGTNDNSYVVDNTAPTVTISSVPATSTKSFLPKFTFSEAVTGFAVGDITLGNATASSFTTATNKMAYWVVVTPTAAGTVTVDVSANAAQDAAGNGNTAATRASSTFTLPAITITAGTAPVPEGTPAVFTLSLTLSTTAELAVNVTVSETGGDMVAAADEGARTVTFQANSTTATLSVATAPDSVDEANSVVTATVAADTGSPASYSVGTPASAMVTVQDNDTRRVTVSATALPVNEGSTGTYRVVLNSQPTASVAVTPSRTGSADVTFSPATLTFTTSTWDTVQTVTVTAAQDSDAVDDSATISHAVTGGDYAGVAADSVVVTVDDDETTDTTLPRVASIVRRIPTSSPTNADSLTWRVTFSEAVSNVDAADFAVRGTTATMTAVATVSGVTGAYDVTASGGNLAGVSATVTLTIASSHNIKDAASNALSNTSPRGTNDNSYVVDNTAPTVTISGVPGTSTAPFRATFTFSEAVTGFAVGGITLGNGAASSFTVTTTTVYRALVTPTAAGAVTVDVSANAARDAAGNGNTAASRASSTFTLPVCSRTMEVQTAILSATTGRATCSDVTATDLAAVTSLTVSNYSGTSLDPADFAGLTGLTSLWINASPQLTTVPDNAFAGLTALTTLNFNDLFSLTTLGEDAFAGLTTLEQLNLSRNLLTTLHADIFDGLTALKRLELQDNLLTTLDEDIFDGLTALEYLDLSFNSDMAALDADIFDGLTALEELELSYTNQTALDADIFDGLTALETLALGYNGLTTLDADLFDGLTALRLLSLSGNSLTTLDADIFDGHTALKELYLNSNLFTTLDADIFDGLTALNRIELQDNRSLAALDADIFDGLTALEHLDLSYTNQTALDADIFDGLTDLETLALLYNGLTTLDADIFDGLTALRLLSLSGNSLTTLDADIFDGHTALDTLALNSNLFTTLDADLFDGLTALDTLALKSNLFTTLDADIFDGLAALKHLYLNSNSLTTLDADIFDGLAALNRIELEDNRLTALDADIFDGITLLDRLDLKCNYFTALDLDIFDPFAATLTYLDLMSDSFTTPPSETAIRAKFPMIIDALTGVTTCLRVTVSPTSLTVTEGATGTYTVALRAPPSGDVTLAISSDNPDVTVAPTTALTFTAANWDTAQTVTVSAAQDTDEADESATLILDPNGSNYDFVNSTALTVTVTDDDGTAVNNVPTVATMIPNRTATSGTAFNYAFPGTTFTDADSDTLTYTATLADDTALPSWLSFSATTRTFSGTPTAVETVSVKVTASDGNGGSVSDSFDIVVSVPRDTTLPRVASIARQNPMSSPTNADSLTWRVTFSEAVSNVDAADFAVSGTTATVTAVAAVSGLTGAYDVTASGGNLAGLSATVTLAISSSHNIADAATNSLTNTTSTGTNDNSYVLDNTAPSVTISGVPGTSTAPFRATFTFSEAVTEFAVDDITLSNATASSFTTTSTTVYTALVTPTASGTVTVDVPANAAQDAVTNGNTAATRASSTFTLPVITITAGPSPVAEGTPAVFTLSRTGSTTAELTVNLTVSETGRDRVAAGNEGAWMVTFLANSATVTLSIATASDSVDEANSVVTATVSADTGSPASYSVGTPDSAAVTVQDNVTTRPVTTTSGGGGGGGGPPPVPIPSDADFDWNVTRDIESLDPDNELPTGIWSDGGTLWVIENSASGADRVFAYDLLTGERQQDAEFELESRNRFSHGIWSDGEIVWVADSGQDQLFAYALETRERDEAREIELAERNRDPRGIWSDGEVMYVLDSVKDALFVYDFETGDLLAEHALDKLNKSPRGIWSDGVTLWVSDDGAKRLFAYEVDGEALRRNEDLEFTFRSLLKAGNGNPRGIWSDGDIMYVVDEQDHHVYTYNIPDVTIAQLASLGLDERELEEFSPHRFEYAVAVAYDLAATTVAAVATQETAKVIIEPADEDGDPENGHQVTLESETTITVTVTSADGSRTKAYLIQVSKPPCLSGLTEERLSEVAFAGGSISELEACARSLNVTAFYHYADAVWTAFFLDAPEFLSQSFGNRFAEGLPPDTSLIANREPAPIAASSAGGQEQAQP